MAKVNLNIIKNWFKTGFKPTQNQFWDTWDSFWHKDDKIPVGTIEGLDDLIIEKADQSVLDNHILDQDAHGLDLLKQQLNATVIEVEVEESYTLDWNEALAEKYGHYPTILLEQFNGDQWSDQPYSSIKERTATGSLVSVTIQLDNIKSKLIIKR